MVVTKGAQGTEVAGPVVLWTVARVTQALLLVQREVVWLTRVGALVVLRLSLEVWLFL